MSDPLVSVVIPVYNGARFLGRCIESALAQSYTPIEIIAVDDGSSDNSPSILDSFCDRISVVHQPNAGVSAARNHGIQVARGEFIAFLDQDDWWLPTKLARQLGVFRTDPDIGLVHTGVSHYDEPSARYVPRMNKGNSELLVGRCYDQLLLGNAIFNSSVVVRRTVLDLVGALSSQISRNTIQDYDLWLRIARVSSLAYVPDPLTVYRLHPAQGMWRVRDMLTEELLLLERVVGFQKLTTSPKLRARMVTLLNQLIVAHFDCFDLRAARATAARSLRLNFTWRIASLWALTLFPQRISRSLRKLRWRARSLLLGRRADSVPAWTRDGTPQAECRVDP